MATQYTIHYCIVVIRKLYGIVNNILAQLWFELSQLILVQAKGLFKDPGQ